MKFPKKDVERNFLIQGGNYVYLREGTTIPSSREALLKNVGIMTRTEEYYKFTARYTFTEDITYFDLIEEANSLSIEGKTRLESIYFGVSGYECLGIGFIKVYEMDGEYFLARPCEDEGCYKVQDAYQSVIKEVF